MCHKNILDRFINMYLFLPIQINAQSSKTHYIPPMTAHDDNSAEPKSQYIFISTPSTTPVNFSLQQVGGPTINGTVTNVTPYELYVGAGYNTPLFINDDLSHQILNNKGYIVNADDLVFVTVKMQAGGTSLPQAAAIVSKGRAGLGKLLE